ncbi:actin cytoskeleton-regulatory complex protein PAN1-like [Cryptomeria japonica]|uniref:actin cytoskeleton-regulatory complex protein PAN1-like n=1 Tax=Cryptomeria japonica TaxID=3369 RepID=UPI0027DA472E|nr:actin cytoskeleton-regulatory complex protein PAN1-like [Cryptomeria japonica]
MKVPEEEEEKVTKVKKTEIKAEARDTARVVKEFLEKDNLDMDHLELTERPTNLVTLSPIQKLKFASFAQAKAREEILKTHMEEIFTSAPATIPLAPPLLPGYAQPQPPLAPRPPPAAPSAPRPHSASAATCSPIAAYGPPLPDLLTTQQLPSPPEPSVPLARRPSGPRFATEAPPIGHRSTAQPPDLLFWPLSRGVCKSEV